MSNQRLLALGLVGLGAFAAYVIAQLLGTVAAAVGVADPMLPGDVHASAVIGFVSGIVGAVVAWRHPRIQEVGQEVAGELKKVTWPTWGEIKAATVAVVVFSCVAAALLGVFDFVSSKVMTDWIPIGIKWAQGLLA